MLRVAGRRLIMLLRIRLIKRWVVVIIVLIFLFFFCDGIDSYADYLRTLFCGGNHRINNFDISYKKEIQFRFFFTKILKNEERKMQEKTHPRNCKIKMQCFVSFFSSLFFPFFLSFFFLTQCCWSFSCWTSYSHLLHVPGAGRGRGVVSCAKSDDDSLDMYIYIHISSSREVQRGPGNRLNRPKLCFLLVIVEIIRDCGQAGKEKLFFYFFWIMALFWVRDLPEGGGRDADTHTHTYTYTYVSQSRVKTDLSQRPLGCVCMYVHVYVYVWNNAKMIQCNVLCPAVFLFRREEGWNEDVLIARPLLPQNGKLLRGELALSLSLPLSPSLSVCRSVLSFLFSDT